MRFHVRDHLGSVREVTTEAGALAARFEFDPYGRVTATQGSVASEAGYTGHRYAAENGLVLSPSRAYDPSIGRWLSEDMAGFADGPNDYQYVRNSPVVNIDPDGRLSASFAVNQVHRFSDTLDMVRACKRPSSESITWGCTDIRVDAFCNCVAAECDQWKALVTLDVVVNVFVRDHPKAKYPAELIIREEAKHVQYAQDTFNDRVRAAGILESKRFSSRFACTVSCMQWVAVTYAKFGLDPTHRKNPHPY